MSTLLIAEKNKSAKAIAEALGPVKIINKLKINIYHVVSKDLYVIPLRGHLLRYMNTENYKNWNNSIPREIITNPKAIEKVPENYAFPYIKILKEYSKLCSSCIIGTDADVEGVNIGLFDALPFIKQINPNIKISQLWLSSLQKKEIMQKFDNLISPKWSWGESGEARAIIDAIIGFSATREVTNTMQPILKKFNRFFISIGRVQTCLLYLIYLRDLLNHTFEPEPYYTLEAKLIINHRILNATHRSNPFKKEQKLVSKKIYEEIKGEKFAYLINKIKGNKIKKPPTPLNTSKSLILLTKNLKIKPNLALKTMSDLYLNKIISYPRTDSDVYKPNFNHLEYLQKFNSHSDYGPYTSELLKENRIFPTKGKKDVGDHPPITPLVSLESNSSKFENELQKKVYDLLARHYLALFGKEAIESKTDLKLSIKGQPFIAHNISLVDKGFLEIVPFMKKVYNLEIELKANEIPIDEIVYREKETQPPLRYSDTTLLKLMERHHLGTKATRPSFIQVLQDRGLIYRNKNHQYYCTELGFFLIENLKEIWHPFLDPSFTKYIEKQLDDIKKNKKKFSDVINYVKNEFLELFDKFLRNKDKIFSKFNNFKRNSKDETNNNDKIKNFPITTSLCPYCKTHPMKLITTKKKKRFLVCENEKCEKKYLSTPKMGRIYILKSECSKCGFNIFKISRRKNNKTFFYYMCPNCWTQAIKEKRTNGFCSNCKDFKISDDKCVEKF